MMRTAGVLVTRKFASYKDVPGMLYHYPIAEYQRAMDQLVGNVVLYYEPRRGGTSESSTGGGRSAFIGFGIVDSILPDFEQPTHAYAKLRYSLNLNRPIPIRETKISGKALQTAVLLVDHEEAQRIIEAGLTLGVPAGVAATHHGLSEPPVFEQPAARDLEEVVRLSRVRDASFRYQIVELAYNGVCAFSGIRQTNGLGRAEVDAAHIRPVSEDGPDVVRNGLAITKTLHWAFDRGLLSLDDQGSILSVERGLDSRLLSLLTPTRTAVLPANEEMRPHRAFLRWHRENVFKGAA